MEKKENHNYKRMIIRLLIAYFFRILDMLKSVFVEFGIVGIFVELAVRTHEGAHLRRKKLK